MVRCIKRRMPIGKEASVVITSIGGPAPSEIQHALALRKHKRTPHARLLGSDIYQ